MSQRLYQLVFSRHLGMQVPVAENATVRKGKSSSKRIGVRLRLILTWISFGFVYSVSAGAAQPSGLIPSATLGWINATIDPARTSASQMTITQSAPKAILNWQQLNLANGQTLAFNQGGNRTWAALNRIFDANPSFINGKVTADGQVYFINTNGIIFGSGAQVNVGSLTATSLNLTDSLFNAGILSVPLRNSDGTLNPVFTGTSGFVQVDPGAQITTASGGRVMLLAPNVQNGGVISTPDGQTIIGAGQKVYLLDSADPAGLLVEVDSGGTATNLGSVTAQRGNVTMVGLAVNQQGMISASTSVRANGSIYLKAEDTASATTIQDSTTGTISYQMSALNAGQVYLGKGSVTQVTVETGDTERVLDSQPFTPSQVQITGRNVEIDGSVIAHGGEINVQAVSNPSNPTLLTGQTPSLYLGQSSVLDVSGADATGIPMSQNQLQIQLFSDQLADAPLLRNGPLFGQTIYVNALKGTPLTDITPFLALIGHTVTEKLSAGGTVSLSSLGDAVMVSGSEVNVSGGSISYDAGYIKESSVSYNGQNVPVSAASPTVNWQGLSNIYSITDPKWGVTRNWDLSPSPSGTFYAAYTVGESAGTVNIHAGVAALDGTFLATTSPGVNQQTSPTPGGAFNLTSLASDIRIADLIPILPANFASTDSLPAERSDTTWINTSVLSQGFNYLSLTSNGGAVTVASKVAMENANAVSTLPDGSTQVGGISLSGAKGVVVNADIRAAGGNISIGSGQGSITVDSGVLLSTAGLWTNDTPGLAGSAGAPVVLKGGNIGLNAATSLALGAGSVVDAGAGAWLSSNGKLQTGNGGNVALVGATLDLAGKLRSYGFGRGGALSLDTYQSIQVGGATSPAGYLALPASFLGRAASRHMPLNPERLAAMPEL